jgi:hypothetical protein
VPRAADHDRAGALVDGGATWSAPLVVGDACGPAGDVDVAVGPHGEIYVAWETIHPDALEVKARRSLDGGKSFGPTGTTGRFLCAGDCRQRLQGHIGQGARFALAVDRSRGATRGSAYLAWTVGRNAGFPDPLSFSGVYGFADVVTSRSIDGGATWSAPVPAHPADPAGAPTDQFQPALAVDAAGRLALCFYDRGRDPLNVLVDYTCALSGDAGRTWAHERVTPSGFAFLRGTDEILSSTVEIGHRTGVAADAMGRQAGFLSAFVVQDRRGNPDVNAARLR